MRQFQLLSVFVVTTFFAASAHSAVPADINVDFTNEKQEVDSVKWSGALSCRWQSFDLVVDLMSKDSHALRVVIPGVKPTMLHTRFKSVSLKLNHEFSFHVLNAKGVKYFVSSQKNAGCTVTTTLPDGSPNVRVTVSCTDLTDGNGDFRNATISSASLECARPTELLK